MHIGLRQHHPQNYPCISALGRAPIAAADRSRSFVEVLYLRSDAINCALRNREVLIMLRTPLPRPDAVRVERIGANQPATLHQRDHVRRSATATVPTDTLTITLFAEEQGVDPTELATKVNTRIEQALTRARNEPGVDARSGGYHTFPLYDRANQPTGWRIRAEIILESRDFKASGRWLESCSRR
jgi:hypothetical protein